MRRRLAVLVGLIHGSTGPVTPRKPVRVRKARHSGACPVCRRLVLVGDLIASIGGGPFVCIEHVTRKDTDGRTAA